MITNEYYLNYRVMHLCDICLRDNSRSITLIKKKDSAHNAIFRVAENMGNLVKWIFILELGGI